MSTRTTALGLVAASLLAAAPVAHGADDNTSITLQAGTPVLTAPTFGDFGTITLDGTRRSVNASVSTWSVNDRGAANGWDVHVSATVPSTGGGTPVTLATAAMNLTAPTAAPADGLNASTAPTVAGGNIVGSGVTVADAADGQGLGIWNLTQGASDLLLQIPSDAAAGTYTSTITTTLTPGVI